jgi:hypothetical protein
MPNAPVIASLEVTASPLNPPNLAEDLSKLDPVFATAWSQTKYLLPARWQGDNSLIGAVAAAAYRYKSGTGVLTPSITTISPTSTAHNVTFTLTINGTNFDVGAKVKIGTAVGELTPATSTPTQITVSVPGSLIATAGTYAIAVRNLNGVLSTTTNLTVT